MEEPFLSVLQKHFPVQSWFIKMHPANTTPFNALLCFEALNNPLQMHLDSKIKSVFLSSFF